MPRYNVQVYLRHDGDLTLCSIRWYDADRPLRGAPWGVKHAAVYLRPSIHTTFNESLREALYDLLSRI